MFKFSKHSKDKPRRPIIDKLLTVFEILTLVIILYITAVFSNTPFISKWRTIYIETAMSTMTHQWLATAFIPGDIVDDVVRRNNKLQELNMVDTNNPDNNGASVWLGYPRGLTPEQQAEKDFIENYDEIDIKTLPKDIQFKDLVLEGEKVAGVKTVSGDSVYAIDTINGIVIVNVAGDGYVGKLAIVKDPSRVKLASSSKSDRGQHVLDIVEENSAILGINASGFYDPNGMGNGSRPVGLVRQAGETIQSPIEYGYWFNVGFDYNNNLMIGSKVDVNTLRDGVQFKPALIIDGEQRVSGSAGWGIQPRTVIGQSSDKEVLMLIIDGRKPTYSIGTTVGECAEIMLRYGATQAINLDGGASSVMVYKGQSITVPSTRGKDGRQIPNAWIVK